MKESGAEAAEDNEDTKGEPLACVPAPTSAAAVAVRLNAAELTSSATWDSRPHSCAPSSWERRAIERVPLFFPVPRREYNRLSKNEAEKGEEDGILHAPVRSPLQQQKKMRVEATQELTTRGAVG